MRSSPWWVRTDRGRPRSPSSSPGSTNRTAVGSPGMVATSATSVRQASATGPASPSRTSSSMPSRGPTTSHWAGSTCRPLPSGCAGPPEQPGRRPCWTGCTTASTHCCRASSSGGPTCQRGSGSAWPWLARSFATPRSSSSTNRAPRWIRGPSTPCSPRCGTASTVERRCSSPTASPRSVGPIGSSSSTAAPS